MRQIFTSQRLETVENVAKLLNEAGIETYVSERRSYKGTRRSQFSYRESAFTAQPAVWIVKSDDQTRARELLRAAGLIDSTRTESFLTPPKSEYANPPPRSTVAFKIRLVLLTAVAVLAVMTIMRMVGKG